MIWAFRIRPAVVKTSCAVSGARSVSLKEGDDMGNYCLLEVHVTGPNREDATRLCRELEAGDLGRVHYDTYVWDNWAKEGYVGTIGGCESSATEALRLTDPCGAFGQRVRELGGDVELYSSECAHGFMEHIVFHEGELVFAEICPWNELPQWGGFDHEWAMRPQKPRDGADLRRAVHSADIARLVATV